MNKKDTQKILRLIDEIKMVNSQRSATITEKILEIVMSRSRLKKIVNFNGELS